MKKTLLALVLFTLATCICFAQNIEVKNGKNLVGLVTDGNKGISNVVVSDGYTVTTTNQNGEYQLTRNPKAKFVFVSTPSNYQIPLAGSIPMQHKAIDQDLKVVYANFQLTPSKVDNNFTLVALADPQPLKPEDLKRFGDETIPDIQELIASYPENTSFLSIAVGDIVWDAFDLYPGIVDNVNKLPFAFLPVIGNHDHDQNVKDNDFGASHIFEKYFGPAYYSYNKGQCHFVVLDDVLYSNRKSYKKEITEEQLEWLKQDLSHVSKDKLIVLGLHIPTKFRHFQVDNADKLYKILEGYEVIIMSGHTHDGEVTIINDQITEYTLNAVFGELWVGDMNHRGVPNGYNIFEFEGNKLANHYFKGTGVNKDTQMTLYPLNTWEGKKNCVIANIWNWNQAWTVEVYENGKLRGEAEQYTDFDPASYEFMFGPEKPVKRPSVEPKKTTTMFAYKPRSKKAVIKFVAKDGFGNEFTSEIDLKKK